MTKIANRFHHDHGRDRYYQDEEVDGQLTPYYMASVHDPDSKDQPDPNDVMGDL